MKESNREKIERLRKKDTARVLRETDDLRVNCPLHGDQPGIITDHLGSPKCIECLDEGRG